MMMTETMLSICRSDGMSTQNSPWRSKTSTCVIHCTILHHKYLIFFFWFIYFLFNFYLNSHAVWNFSSYVESTWYSLDISTYYWHFQFIFFLFYTAEKNCLTTVNLFYLFFILLTSLLRLSSARFCVLLIIEMAKMKEQLPRKIFSSFHRRLLCDMMLQ